MFWMFSQISQAGTRYGRIFYHQSGARQEIKVVYAGIQKIWLTANSLSYQAQGQSLADTQVITKAKDKHANFRDLAVKYQWHKRTYIPTTHMNLDLDQIMSGSSRPIGPCDRRLICFYFYQGKHSDLQVGLVERFMEISRLLLVSFDGRLHMMRLLRKGGEI